MNLSAATGGTFMPPMRLINGTGSVRGVGTLETDFDARDPLCLRPSATPPTGYLQFSLEVPTIAFYRLTATILSPHGLANSFYVQLGAAGVPRVWNTAVTGDRFLVDLVHTEPLAPNGAVVTPAIDATAAAALATRDQCFPLDAGPLHVRFFPVEPGTVMVDLAVARVPPLAIESVVVSDRGPCEWNKPQRLEVTLLNFCGPTMFHPSLVLVAGEPCANLTMLSEDRVSCVASPKQMANGRAPVTLRGSPLPASAEAVYLAFAMTAPPSERQSSLSSSVFLGLTVGIPVAVFVAGAGLALFFYLRRRLLMTPQRDNSAAVDKQGDPFSVVFTDIQASTQLWSNQPLIMSKAVDDHHAIIRHAIAKFGGYEVKTIGDAFMVVFKRPAEAVLFASCVQEKLWQHEWAPELNEEYDTITQGDAHADSMEELAMAFTSVRDDQQNTSSASRRSYTRRQNQKRQASTISQAISADGADALTSAPPARAAAAVAGSVLRVAATPVLKEKRRWWNGLRVRIGITHGAGDIKFDDVTRAYDYYGTIVNTAARVEAEAFGGEILVTQTVWIEALATWQRQGKIDVADTVVATDLGPFSLRGIAAPVGLMRVTPVGLAGRIFPQRDGRRTGVSAGVLTPTSACSPLSAQPIISPASCSSHAPQTLQSFTLPAMKAFVGVRTPRGAPSDVVLPLPAAPVSINPLESRSRLVSSGASQESLPLESEHDQASVSRPHALSTNTELASGGTGTGSANPDAGDLRSYGDDDCETSSLHGLRDEFTSRYHGALRAAFAHGSERNARFANVLLSTVDVASKKTIIEALARAWRVSSTTGHRLRDPDTMLAALDKDLRHVCLKVSSVTFRAEMLDMRRMSDCGNENIPSTPTHLSPTAHSPQVLPAPSVIRRPTALSDRLGPGVSVTVSSGVTSPAEPGDLFEMLGEE